MPELSIIVPVYNVEKYIDKCIESILAQTFNDFELILIDDGSPDKCGQICDQYADKDNRIKVIHKKNGGLSDARNAGLDVAKGRYIGFVDSDDYISNDMYDTLIKNLKKYNAGISVCGVYDCYGDKHCIQKIDSGVFEFNVEQAIEYFLGGKGIGLFSVNKLYKREIFNKVRYPVGRIYEDAFVILDVILEAEKVVVDTAPKYFYLHRENSITVSKFNSKYYDIIEAHKKNFDIIKRKFPQKKEVGEFRIYWAYKQLLYIMAFNSKENRKIFKKDVNKICNFIRKNFFSIIKNKFNSRSQKLSYLLIYISPYLFMNVVSRTSNN